MEQISEKYREITGKKCFFNIMPLENIASVIEKGILSHDNINTEHKSIAMSEIQERREKVSVPNGLRLHQYANLYFDYKNPMLYKKKNINEQICILAISADVLAIDGCIVTDRNASTDVVRFYEPNEGIEKIDFEIVFEQNWNFDDRIKYQKHKAIKCAEVLVPYRIPPEYIICACVVNDSAKKSLEKQGFNKRIIVDKTRFF